MRANGWYGLLYLLVSMSIAAANDIANMLADSHLIFLNHCHLLANNMVNRPHVLGSLIRYMFYDCHLLPNNMANQPRVFFFFFPKKTPSISYKILQMRLVCTNP